MEVEVEISQSHPRDDEPFFREGASWTGMLFQQPPRSCIGLVEKEGKAVDGPAYTEIEVQPDGDYLRIGDIAIPCATLAVAIVHPLPEEGLIWIGRIRTEEELETYPFIAEYPPPRDSQHGDIPQSHVTYAKSVYLQDCDVVFFTMECGWIRGKYVDGYPDNPTSGRLGKWLRDMRASCRFGYISIPMLVD